MRIAAFAALAALACAPALAGEAKHESGVELPTVVEGLAAERLLDEPFNLAAGYSGKGEAITIYVFRATHPNAALWFERAESVLRHVWAARGLGEGGETRQFALGSSAGPNGLRRVFAVRGQDRSTALAVAQVGPWLVKVRSTSATLDVAGQEARLDRVLGAIGAKELAGAPNPLTLPEPCPPVGARDDIMALLGSEAIPKPDGATVVAAGLVLTMAATDLAGGKDSLAANPGLYCRATIEGVGPMAMLYRRKDASKGGWTALLADSGTSVSAMETIVMEGKDAKSGGLVTANGLDKVRAVLFAKGVPTPETAFLPAAQILMSRDAPAYAAVAYGTTNVEVALPDSN